MDIQKLEEICEKYIDNECGALIGACHSCVRIVVDYHDSMFLICYLCKKGYCRDCIKWFFSSNMIESDKPLCMECTKEISNK